LRPERFGSALKSGTGKRGEAVSTSTFTSLYAVYALLGRQGSLIGGEASAWIAAWSLPVIIDVQVSYLSLFPTGRLPSRR
jgi:hypothetical protein